MQLRKLKPRLQALADVCEKLIITESIEQFVDTCCDHGYLGQYLLQQQAALGVNFVDVLPHLCKQLEADLPRYNFYQPDRVRIINTDASLLNIQRDLSIAESQSVLYVIAGVGADILNDILKGLLKTHQALLHRKIYFLVSPSNNMFRLRRSLTQLPLNLVDEGFVADRGRGYEYILLQLDFEKIHLANPHFQQSMFSPVSLVGEFWGLKIKDNVEQRRYIMTLLNHFKRQQQSLSNKPVSDTIKEEVELALKLYYQLIKNWPMNHE